MKTVRYTAAQLEALDIGRSTVDTCIVAGPGSGKTTVLVEYFGRLVAAGADPLRILAITFTEKAAGNMREKLAATFAEDAPLRARLERAWVSTVHGFCARLLRENAIFAGVDPQFYVADERESWRMQETAMAAAVEEVFAERPAAMRSLIRGLSSFEFEGAVLSAYDAMRGAGTRVEDLAHFPAPEIGEPGRLNAVLAELRGDPLSGWNANQKAHLADVLEGAERFLSSAAPLAALQAIDAFSCNLRKLKSGTRASELAKELRELIQDARYGAITEYYASERKLLIALLERFDRLYRARKQQAGALDFSDLEEYTVRLLESNPAVRARLNAQFDYVLMDELQDTNGQQAKLLNLVRPPDRLYAVGDVNQSIFGFRHAETRLFLGFRDSVVERGHRLVDLRENFRSRAEVLRAVETVVAGLPGIEPRRLVAAREFAAPRPLAVEAMGAIADDAEQALRLEAQWVAGRILELRETDGFQFRQMAVLVRNTEVLGEFTDAFERASIPAVVNRGRGFYESREVNDLVHLLRGHRQPARRNQPCGRAALASGRGFRLKRSCASGRSATASPVRSTASARKTKRRSRRRISAACNTSASNCAAGGCAANMSLSIACWSKRSMNPATGPNPVRAARRTSRSSWPHARAAAVRMSLDEFVEELALIRASNPREADAPPEDSADAVQLMTVHSAKGLEFPVVFVAALHKGVESNPPLVAFTPEIGLGARWRNPAHQGKREEKDDLFQHALRRRWQERDRDESHRLLYVAMTRAEEHLVLSFAANIRKNWAKVISAALDLNFTAPGDEVRTIAAPDGAEWQLRVRAVDRVPEMQASPPAALAAAEEIVQPALAEITGQHESQATVTALAKFAVCPREYYLGDYLGFEGRVEAPASAETRAPSSLNGRRSRHAGASPAFGR